MGRPVELLAAGSGRCADVFVLSRDGGQLVSERMDGLSHEGGVWKVEWDMLGLSLAVGTDAQRVYVWRGGLDGEWRITSLLQGDASVRLGSEDDMAEEEE